MKGIGENIFLIQIIKYYCQLK